MTPMQQKAALDALANEKRVREEADAREALYHAIVMVTPRYIGPWSTTDGLIAELRDRGYRIVKL